MLIDAAFEPMVGHLDLADYEATEDTVFIVDEGLIIRAVNPAYLEFGRANGLPDVREQASLGCDLEQAIDPFARDLTVALFGRALTAGRPYHHNYECSSPDTIRRFRQSLYPLPRMRGLVVSNHLIYTAPYPERPEELDSAHISPSGVIFQCCQCRKVRNWTRTNSWDWIPALVASVDARVSQTFCDFCRKHIFPDLDR